MSLRYCFACKTAHLGACPNRRRWRGPNVARLRALIYDRDAGICQDCGAHVAFSDFQLDHIQPRSMGGTDEANNLRATCTPCNQSKGG